MEKKYQNKYEGAIKRYISFCRKAEANLYNSNDTIVIEFLTQEFGRGMSSSVINCMIAAIKKISNQDSGYPINKIFTNRFFKIYMAIAKYEHTCLIIKNSVFCKHSVKENLENMKC